MKYLLTDSVRHLKIPSIRIYRRFFPDGELYIKIGENIKGKEISIISNILPTNLLEILFVVDAIKRSGGKIRELIIPYAGYARQSGAYEYGEAASGRVVFSLLNNLNFPVRIFDVHNESLRDCLDFKNENILLKLAELLPKENFVVISPDEGGFKRASEVAKFLKADVFMIKKDRKGGRISMNFSHNLMGKNVLIVDDMISTGATLISAFKILKKNHAENIYCIVTHGLFTGNTLKKLKAVDIKKIIVSNSLPFKGNKQVKIYKIQKILLGF